MSTPTTRTKAARWVAALATATSVGTLVATNQTPAAADPQSATALVGVGSDTTQDVLNALAGFNNGINYTPIQSSAASGRKQLASWDAVPAGSCITPKSTGATFDRPNGSTNGRKALSRSIDGATWSVAGSPCPPAKVVSGLVDFARSSGGSSNPTATDLTYLPFGRDAVSFGYYGNGVTPVTSLTSAQLQNLYINGPQTINGVNVIPCLPQTGSGTRSFWITAMGTTDTIATAATAACNGTVQENDGNALKAKGLTFATTQVVIPFSAANFISQSNGVAASQLSNAAGVDLGSIDALGVPYTGTGSSLAPSATFYGNGTYGRNVYNVVDSIRIGPPAAANADLKSLLVGPTSAICSAAAQTTVNAFGFLSLTSGCGATTLTGPLL